MTDGSSWATPLPFLSDLGLVQSFDIKFHSPTRADYTPSPPPHHFFSAAAAAAAALLSACPFFVPRYLGLVYSLGLQSCLYLHTDTMAPDLNSLPSSPNLTKEQTPFNGQGNGTNPSLGNGTKRPNILYIMADQMSAPQLKMYNPDSQIKTPHLDSLAARSVQFDSAYCPSPLCAPSRMSMISGQLPMKIGAYDNASQIGSDVLTYAHYLRTRGYHTVLAGKMHFVGDQLHGYETRLTSDIYPGDFGWAVDWDNPETRLEWYHNASSIKQAGVCVRSNQLDYDEEVMFKSTQFLYDQVRKSDDRPFCLTVRLIKEDRKTLVYGWPDIEQP